jgi:anaerobic magnesium-protoporphyrin IX monomethyl ester cyclase
MDRSDLHIIFPPQWSPFQPFLSLPSLKAYLQGRGYVIEQSDWNVDFYEYFISPPRLAGALRRLETYFRSLSSEHDAYKNQVLLSLGILSEYGKREKLAARLRSPECTEDIEDFYKCVISFKRLLQAFSVAEPVVNIGTSSFSAANVMGSIDAIHRFCEDRDCNPFIAFFENKIRALRSVPRYFGISVIGTEQLLPSLTLSRCLKSAFPEVPIVVGGSVFSRLVERTDRIKEVLGRYFDVICRYEGEVPMDAFLGAADPLRERTPGIAFMQGEDVIKTDLAPQLTMEDIPTPDFDGIDLKKYFSPEVVLPLLTTRGCYWDKCAFCYHGMIYGDRYRMRAPEAFAADVDALHSKYRVRHFALNDEAIPPKLFEKLPAVIPRDKYFFTGLYKFEKYFEAEHFEKMYSIGFRSLYIGLETASERVQQHMRKNNTQAVMLSNLRDAHEAGIWSHTFNFFGFPTETREEAQETIDFLVNNANIIHSEGTGTFSFEHNAPIFKNPAAFGITEIIDKSDNVFELYYDYAVARGMSSGEASDLMSVFADAKKHAGVFQYGGWIPREQLLVLLSRHHRDPLRRTLNDLESRTQLKSRRELTWFSITEGVRTRYFIVNSENGRILETNKDAILLIEFFPPAARDETLLEWFPPLSSVFGIENVQQVVGSVGPAGTLIT